MMGGCFWQDNETFVDDGIQLEPFNLSKEREEGYFDASGNYVEYINENDIKVGTVVSPKVSRSKMDLFVIFTWTLVGCMA